MLVRKQTTFLLSLFVALGTWNSATHAAFFDFLKLQSSENFDESVDTNPIRGAPVHTHAKYTADPFACDGGAKHPLSVVNDGYCDCSDGSDEPGTSACPGTVFHCINQGYKIQAIPSSRVDDQICDCCDGSDEGRVAKCPNTCKQVAQQEMAQIAKITKDFEVGSKIREALIESVKKEKAEAMAGLPTLRTEVDTLTNQVESLSSSLKEIGERITIVTDRVVVEEKSIIGASINFRDSLQLRDLAMFISNLFKVLNTPSHKINSLIKKRGGDANRKERDNAKMAKKRAFKPASISSPDDDDEFVEVPDPQNDDDDDNGIHGEESQEGDGGEGEDDDAPTCHLVELAQDDFALLPLCDTVDSVDSSVDFIVDFMQEQKPFAEVMLLLGFFKLHGTFEGSDVFAKSHLETQSADSCPAEFAAIETGASKLKENSPHCGLKEQLLTDLSTLEEQFGLDLLKKEQEELKAEKTDKESKKREAEGRRNNAQDAEKDLEQYRDHLAFLAMKDECFEVADGNYKYSLCMLDKVTQKEISGTSQVTLGRFKAPLEASTEQGDSVVMKHENGQHCHAFGARKATVKVVCGAKNELKSASEPSTCSYELLFESPAACTPQFAAMNGIPI